MFHFLRLVNNLPTLITVLTIEINIPTNSVHRGSNFRLTKRTKIFSNQFIGVNLIHIT